MKLSAEIWKHILENLDFQSLTNSQSVCREFYYLGKIIKSKLKFIVLNDHSVSYFNGNFKEMIDHCDYDSCEILAFRDNKILSIIFFNPMIEISKKESIKKIIFNSLSKY